MARHPNAIDKINYIVEFVADVCDAPFSVYFESFFPALFHLLVSYFWLDLLQIVTGFTRPIKALARSRRGPHGSGRKTKGRRKTRLSKWKRWLSYDPWDHLGRTLGGLTDLPGREVSGGVLHFWKLFDILQTVAYYYMVFDLTETFFYEWFSAVNASFYCVQQRASIVLAHGDTQQRTGLLNPWPTICPYIDKQRGLCSWNISVGVYLGQTASFGFSAGLEPTGVSPATFMQLVITGSDGSERRADWDPLKPNDRNSLAFKIVPGVSYAIGTFGNGIYNVISPSIFMQGLDTLP